MVHTYNETFYNNKKLSHMTNSETTNNAKTWVVYSNDNNNGLGGWDYHYPVQETDEDLDYWFKNNRYNSMVDCRQFKSFEDALAYHNEMNK